MDVIYRFVATRILLLAVWTFPIVAHGGHDERIKLRLADKQLHVEMHISAQLLQHFDRDGNGNLSAKEFRSASADIKHWIRSQIIIQSGATVLDPVFFDIPVSEGDMSHDGGAVKFVRIIQQYQKPESVGLTIKIALYAEGARQVLFFKNGEIFRKTFTGGTIQMVLD